MLIHCVLSSVRRSQYLKKMGSISVSVSGAASDDHKNLKKTGSIPVPVSGAALEDQKFEEHGQHFGAC